MTETSESHAIDRLFAVIHSRRGADPSTSYTASLFDRGVPVIARKVGEEAVETVVEAVGGSGEALTAESADLLYHLLVLWAARDIKPQDVWDELDRRSGVSGHAEKAARGAQSKGDEQ